MTDCCGPSRTFQRPSRTSDTRCTTCVYFSKNLDSAEYPVLMDTAERCGLGFLPGDAGCAEMHSDNCSARKAR